MDAQSILDKIALDARQLASRQLDEAREKAAQIRREADERIALAQEKNRNRIERDLIEQEQRMLRMAELEDKKAVLAAKRAVMDSTYQKAIDALCSLDKQTQRDFLMQKAVGLANGATAIYAASGSTDIIDAAFVAELNQALAQQGAAPLSLESETPKGHGFVMKKGGAMLSCTFETLVQTLQQDTETAVSSILFE